MLRWSRIPHDHGCQLSPTKAMSYKASLKDMILIQETFEFLINWLEILYFLIGCRLRYVGLDTNVFSPVNNNANFTNGVVKLLPGTSYTTCRTTCINSYQPLQGVLCLGISYDNVTGNCSTVYAGTGNSTVKLTNYQTLTYASAASGK